MCEQPHATYNVVYYATWMRLNTICLTETMPQGPNEKRIELWRSYRIENRNRKLSATESQRSHNNHLLSTIWYACCVNDATDNNIHIIVDFIPKCPCVSAWPFLFPNTTYKLRSISTPGWRVNGDGCIPKDVFDACWSCL